MVLIIVLIWLKLLFKILEFTDTYIYLYIFIKELSGLDQEIDLQNWVLKLGELSWMSYGNLIMGGLGEMSFEIMKLGELE